MAPNDLRIVILPSEEIFPVAPWCETPNGWQASAVDPHRRIIGWIPRRREKCWNHFVQGLGCGRSRLSNVDAIRRVGELEIVYGCRAKNLAQLGHGNSPGLAPRLLDLGSPVVSPPTSVSYGRRSIRPGVSRIFQHQRQRLRETDIPAEAIFAKEGWLLERFRPVGAAAIVRSSLRKCRREIRVQNRGPGNALA